MDNKDTKDTEVDDKASYWYDVYRTKSNMYSSYILPVLLYSWFKATFHVVYGKVDQWYVVITN